jgi:uncharacterized membrane protein
MQTIPLTRRMVFAAAGMLVALAPVVYPAHAVAQGCTDSEIEDSYSLQCVPSTVPDFNDQLTEAEVAEPGFNSHPGGGGGVGGGGGGGHR